MPELPSSTTPTAAQMNIALLLIRIASALAFLYHGSAILFGAFGGPGPHGFAAYMHAPDIIGYLVGLAQFAGGIAILSGVLIRVGARLQHQRRWRRIRHHTTARRYSFPHNRRGRLFASRCAAARAPQAVIHYKYRLPLWRHRIPVYNPPHSHPARR
jgi:hypothetical protein